MALGRYEMLLYFDRKRILHSLSAIRGASVSDRSGGTAPEGAHRVRNLLAQAATARL